MNGKKLIDLSSDLRKKKILGTLEINDKKMIDYNLNHMANEESLKFTIKLYEGSYTTQLKMIGPALGMRGQKELNTIEFNLKSRNHELNTKMDNNDQNLKFTTNGVANDKKVWEVVLSSEGSPAAKSYQLT